MDPLFVANWKMNKSLAEATDFCKAFAKLYTPASNVNDVGIAPPLSALAKVSEELSTLRGVSTGVQNVHWLENGAHTGEISTSMASELGASFAILGHSERREHYGETSEGVASRAKTVLSSGMMAIVCVGETKEQFESRKTEETVRTQLSDSLAGVNIENESRLVVAYEPVWAIGTGLAATPKIAGSVHSFIRQELIGRFSKLGEKIPLLYGGSTKPENISELIAQEHVNGALVGGASLKAESFWKLIENGRG